MAKKTKLTHDAPPVINKKLEDAGDPLEKKLWKAADKLRKNMDAAEYKHVVLGLIFLKYISDACEELFQKLTSQKKDGADPEDKNEYIAEKVFYVPPKARWSYLQGRAKLPTIGKDIDDAMDFVEKDNPQSLKGVLPKVYAQEKLDKASLGGLIDMISTSVLGTKEAQSKDLLGRVFEYFLGEFALAEGKKGGQFYTPGSVVKLLVEMLEPYEGRVFDPCCGSGGMFVQSEKFIKHHQDHYKKNISKKLSLNPADHISIYGQESNQTTWRLAKMNLAIRGIDSSNVKWNNEGSFLNDAHKDLKADYIIANPPFNDSDWSGDLLRKDARWNFGVPPPSSANFAWMQHFIYHLSSHGLAGIVLANGSLSSDTQGEDAIRNKIIESNLVDCIVMLPNQLFYNTAISACLWFINKKKTNTNTLFIDAANVGSMISRKNRIFTEEDVSMIASTYHEWKANSSKYVDIKGFCKSATINEIKKQNYILTPGRYVSDNNHGTDGISYIKKIEAINTVLQAETIRTKEIDKQIQQKLNFYYPNLEWNNVLFSSSEIMDFISMIIFNQWFVDFNFPDENGKPYKENGGKFYKTEIGKIPVGWEVVTLEDAVEKSNTGADAIQKAPIVVENTGIKCLRIGDLSNDRDFNEWGFTKVTDKIFKQYKLKRNDIIVTRTSILGLNLLIMEDLNSVYNNGLIRISIKENHRAEFIYSFLQSNRYRNYINRITNETSTRPNMKINYLLSFPILKIPKEIENKFSDFYSLFLLKKHHNRKQIEKLSSNLNSKESRQLVFDIE